MAWYRRLRSTAVLSVLFGRQGCDSKSLLSVSSMLTGGTGITTVSGVELGYPPDPS